MREEDFHREFDIIKAQCTQLLAQVTALIQQGDRNMSAISDAVANLITEVQETKAGIDSALVFIQGLKDQIQALIDAGTVTPAQLQDLANQLDAKQQEIAAAITTPPPTP
jgi:DNA repair exonuclease SbcCD ATPase subunit